MKKSLIYVTELLLLIYIIIFNSVIVKYFLNYLNLINIVFFILLSLVTYYLLGFPKNKRLINYNAIQIVVIGFIIYYVIIYVLGLFFGFVSNVYSLSFFNILKNILLFFGYYFFREVYRFMVIKQTVNKKKLSYCIITILFVLLDIIMEINGYDLTNGMGMFDFICASLIPNIAINMLLSYVSCKFSFNVLILTIMMLKIPNYILPIFPDLGSYLSSVLLIVLIFYVYYKLSLLLEKYDRKLSLKKQSKGNLSLIFIFVPTFILVGIVSGLFKYHLFAIVSNSMIPEFSLGDAVLVEKIKSDDLDSLEIGDIIAFYATDGKIIVHRIMSIEKNGEIYHFVTKGDNNDSVDSIIVNNNNIYGKVLFSIKYIGIPSVELKELIS